MYIGNLNAKSQNFKSYFDILAEKKYFNLEVACDLAYFLYT